MPRRLLVVLLIVLAALAVAAGWWAGRVPAVPALVLQPAALQRSLLFAARVAAPQRVDVGATITGRVQAVGVAEGAAVRAGQPLVQLEDAELRAALAQARASAQQAAARLAGLRSTGRGAAQAGVAQAESTLLAAQAELRRTRELLAQGFVSPARLDEAQRAVAVAQAQRDAAAAQRSAVADQGTDIAQAQAALALAEAAAEAAAARLAQAVLRAPADARVLQRSVEPGQIVQPGRALLALALQGPVQLSGQVDERYLGQLQTGQTASVVADAYPGQRFAARVDHIAPLVDAQRGAVEVKLTVPDAAPAFLREDMTLSIAVETGRRDRALVLPAAAFIGPVAEGRVTVHRLVDGRVQAVRVRLGLQTLDGAEALDGVAAGDTVLLAATPGPGARATADTSAAAGPAPGATGSGGAALSGAMGR
ncbi:MAG TPA: efflux RND transporter periplasmic adaptor subunit [Aquabacterium sp.]|nr:efflux RND transporter periplasmic adaptor subunit [Aquabacterium sp.]